MAEWNLGLPSVAMVPRNQPEEPPLPTCGVPGCDNPVCNGKEEEEEEEEEEEVEDDHSSQVWCESCEEWKPARYVSVVDEVVTRSEERYSVSVVTDSDGDKRLTREGSAYYTDIGDSEVTDTSVVCDHCGGTLEVYDVDGARV